MPCLFAPLKVLRGQHQSVETSHQTAVYGEEELGQGKGMLEASAATVRSQPRLSPGCSGQ